MSKCIPLFLPVVCLNCAFFTKHFYYPDKNHCFQLVPSPLYGRYWSKLKFNVKSLKYLCLVRGVRNRQKLTNMHTVNKMKKKNIGIFPIIPQDVAHLKVNMIFKYIFVSLLYSYDLCSDEQSYSRWFCTFCPSFY